MSRISQINFERSLKEVNRFSDRFDRKNRSKNRGIMRASRFYARKLKKNPMRGGDAMALFSTYHTNMSIHGTSRWPLVGVDFGSEKFNVNVYRNISIA